MANCYWEQTVNTGMAEPYFMEHFMRKQTTLLLDHLKRVGNISRIEADHLYRIAALPRRISDLEEMGYVIARELKRDITGRRYTRYYLMGWDTAENAS